MNWNNRWARVFFIALFAAIWPHLSLADYITINRNSLPAAVRIRDDGSTVPISYTNSIPQSIKNDVEAFGDSVGVTPDLKTVYSFANTLGYANYVFASNADTGQYLATQTMQLSGYPPVGDYYVTSARAPLIVGNEVFVIDGHAQVKRFNLVSEALVQTILPPTSQQLDDITLNPSGSRLYVAGLNGIYSYSKSGSTYSSPTTIIPGVDGNLTYGPNDILYVKNFANGDIQRYTSTGTFIDTFISHTSFPNLGWIHFGVDGNFHAFQTGANFNFNNILKFNGTTGALLSTATSSVIGNGRLTYVFPIPEPSSFAMICVGTVAWLAGLRPKRRS